MNQVYTFSYELPDIHTIKEFILEVAKNLETITAYRMGVAEEPPFELFVSMHSEEDLFKDIRLCYTPSERMIYLSAVNLKGPALRVSFNILENTGARAAATIFLSHLRHSLEKQGLNT